MACKECGEERVRDGFDFCCSYCAKDWEAEHPQQPKFEVCDRCRGHGTHTNPAIDGNGITASEMAELGPDFREDYMNGVYDIRCTRCNGQRVINVSLQSQKLKEIEDAEALMEMRMEAPHMFI